MSSSNRRALHHGWVLVSYFLVIGCLALSFAGWVLIDIQFDALPYVAFAMGALAGGFFAGRLCPHKRFNEPATAAVAVVMTLVALMSTTLLGPRIWEDSQGTIIWRSLILGACSLLGALLGTYLGHRTSPVRPSESAWRWAGISILLGLGAITLAVFVQFAILFRQHAPETAESSLILPLFAIMALASMFAAVMTQVLAPRRMPWITGMGGGVTVVSMGVLGMAMDHKDDLAGAIFGSVIIMGMYWVVGYLGARIGWFLKQRPAPEPPLPDAFALPRD